jgi:hypothetical protein
VQRQEFAQRAALVLTGANGGEQQQWQLVGAPQQVREEALRRLVGPLQVVDDEHDRPALAEVGG